MKNLLIAVGLIVNILATAAYAAAQGLPPPPPTVPGHCENCGDDNGRSGQSSSASDRREAREYSRYVAAYNHAHDLYSKAIHAPAAQALRMNQQALAYLNEALRHQPSDADALKLHRQAEASEKTCLGELAEAKGDYDQAIAFYREAEQLYPESNALWETHIARAQQNRTWARGSELQKQGDFHGAEALWRQILASDSVNANAYFNLAAALSGQGRDDEALEAFQQAHRLNPKDLDTISRINKLEKTIATNHEQQALKQQDKAAAANISSSVGALLNDIGSADGQTRSTALTVNGKQEEFTVLGHPESGPSKALSQLPGIAGDDKQAAGTVRNEGADAKDRLQLGFDTAGHANGAISPVVVGDQGPRQAANDKDLLKDPQILKDSQIQGYLKKKAQAEERYQELSGQLKTINGKIAGQDGNKGELQVTANQVLDQMAAAKSEADAATINAQDRAHKLSFTVDMTETPPKPKRVEPPSPSPAAGSQSRQ